MCLTVELLKKDGLVVSVMALVIPAPGVQLPVHNRNR